jgi:hypothetical protein
MIDRIDRDENYGLYWDMQNRSMPNRLTNSGNFRSVQSWLAGTVSGLSSNIVLAYDNWSTYSNLILTIPGQNPAAGQYLLGGHLDSVAAGPGMDDDASGSLGSAIVVMALAGFSFAATVRIILFDAEESGLIGSNHYANAAFSAGDPIKYYLNLDMIGYDPLNGNNVTVYSSYQYIKDLYASVAANYNVGGITTIPGGAQGCNSDHCRFDQLSYHTANPWETTFNSPNYHRASDTIDKMNFDTLTNILKLTAGVLATNATFQTRVSFTASFSVSPAACGPIVLDGSSYSDGQSAPKATGTYTVSAAPCAGYALQSLSGSGGASVRAGMATLRGNGTLSAIYVPAAAEGVSLAGGAVLAATGLAVWFVSDRRAAGRRGPG